MPLNSYIDGYAFGECRLLGHLWDIVPSDWTPRYGVPMTVRCQRCSIERRDSVNRNTGIVESRAYTYPKGYALHRENGYELPKRADFRLAWLDGVLRQHVTKPKRERR